MNFNMDKNNDNNKHRTPKLRFPGFEGEWAYVNGDVLFEPISNKNHNSDLPILALTQDQGAIPRELINYKIQVSEKSVEGYKVVDIDDFIISLRSFQGGIEYSKYKGLCSPAYIVLRKKNKNVVSDFYRHYFKSFKYIQDLNKNLEGIRDGKMISFKQFSEIQIPFPSPIEQQKIAECLSSLDEEIAAEAQKADALKDHKKGLMQQLFPAISNEQLAMSNCVPKLRFPGFEGEWVVKKLGEIAEKVNSRNRDKSETRVLTNSATEGVVDQNDYFDRDIAVKENTDNYHIVEINDFVYNPRISSSAPVGPISRNKIGKGIMSPLYTVFRFKSEDINFLEHFFNTTIWHKYLKSVANYGARFDRMAISTEDFYSMPILLPTLAEQQKIADCLSELDEMISAQQQKVEALKEHKKGLMQKLFPKMSN